MKHKLLVEVRALLWTAFEGSNVVREEQARLNVHKIFDIRVLEI